MRKVSGILLYIIGIALLASCSWTEIEPRDSISFRPVSAKATKSIINGATYPTSESFMVSAYYEGTDAYFTDLAASYSSALNLWATSASQYWPLSGSLSFIAYSPASASGVSIDATDGVTATDYTIQNGEQMTTDLCYASATVADCSSHPDAVPITFSHALSQIVFRVKAARYYSTGTNSVSLSMTSLTLGNILSVGDFASGSWSNQATPFTYTLANAPISLTYDSNNVPETIDVCSFVFIPQELSSTASINVSYGIVQTVSGNTYTLDNPPVSIPLRGTITEWQPGRKYIYTLNIGMNNVITLSVSTVGWQDESDNIIVEEN